MERELASHARTQQSLSYGEALNVGVLSGLIAGTIQVIIGWVTQTWFLPAGQDNNIAPRLINRLARKTDQPSSPLTEWALGTAFHYSYAAGWGAVFGLVKRWSGLPSLPLGAGIGWFIYLLAFSRIGAGTHTGTERHPDRRHPAKQIALVTIAGTFGLSQALAFDRLTRHQSRPH